MRRSFVILIILLLGSALHSAAQDYNVFNSYGINEGLPQSSIWNISQDKNGFMWFSTADGICRFDGYDFKVYRSDPADSNSILNTSNCKFYIDTEGDLWTISLKGICLYNYEKDNFRVIYKDDTKSPFYYHNYCFFGEYRGYIWASMPLQGLLRINKSKRKAEIVKRSARNNYEPVITGDQQKVIFRNGFIDSGKIWIGLGVNNCAVYDIDKDELHRISLPLSYAVSRLNDSEIIIATREGILLLNKNTLKYREISLGMELQARQIMVVSDTLLLATSFRGLVHINSKTWKISRIINSFDSDKKQTYSNIHCVYKDRSGNLWIGTDGDGIKKLRAPNKKFRYYSSFSISNLVKAIYVAGQKLYVGYFRNDLDIFDRKTGLIANKVITLDTLNYHHIYAICPIDSNTLLLSKVDANLAYTYSLTTGRIKSLFPIIRKILPDRVLPSADQCMLRRGNIIYLVAANHIITLDVSSPQNITASLFYSFPNETATHIFIDSKGTFWIGTINGIYYLKNGVAKMVALPEMIRVKTINEDVKGNLWVGSLEGIYIIDANKKYTRKYTEKNGLSNGFIYGILRDDDDNMWFSHNKGLSVYYITTGKFRHYTKEDGLQSNEFNTGAYYKATDGTLFFGGINGTNSFKPEDIKDNPNLPRMVITNVKLFDQNYKTDVAYWNLREIKLPYNQNSLTFEFAGLEYTNSEQNQYAYIMEGLDEKWIYSGKTRFARYPALPPGTYYFKVKGSNNDGIWQNQPAVLKVVIVPPFQQTWWFRTILVILLVVLVVGIMSWYQRQRQKAQLRAIELQQKIQQERERISRDLHDNVGTQLSLISNNIEWIEHPLKELSEKEKLEKLHFVNRISRDIIATLRETIWALKKEQISLEEFSDKLKAFVQKQLTVYPEIELEFNELIDEPLTLGPSEALNLFRICQEAVANALKYSGAKKINISIENRKGKYIINIQDKGRGFDINEVDASVQNGLENMRYRSTDIGCILTIETEIGKGTTVSIVKK